MAEEQIKQLLVDWKVTYYAEFRPAETKLHNQKAFEVIFSRPSHTNPVPLHDARAIFFMSDAGEISFRMKHERYRHQASSMPSGFLFDKFIDPVIAQKERLDQEMGPMQSNLAVFRAGQQEQG